MFETASGVDRISGAQVAPFLVLMHHPPFLTGIRRMDQADLPEAPVSRKSFGVTPKSSASSAGFFMVDRKPLCRNGRRDRSEHSHPIVLDPPRGAAQLRVRTARLSAHYWRARIGLVTHTAAIGDWPGPYFYSRNWRPTDRLTHYKAVRRRRIDQAALQCGTGAGLAYICFVASTSTTPAKVGNQRLPMRSHAAAERKVMRFREGGIDRAVSDPTGVIARPAAAATIATSV